MTQCISASSQSIYPFAGAHGGRRLSPKDADADDDDAGPDVAVVCTSVINRQPPLRGWSFELVTVVVAVFRLSFRLVRLSLLRRQSFKPRDGGRSRVLFVLTAEARSRQLTTYSQAQRGRHTQLNCLQYAFV